MPPWRPRILMSVPQHADVRLEIYRAMHKLAAEIEQDNELHKRAERAEAERSLKDLQRRCDEAVEALCAMSRRLSKHGYDPDEPRVPAGHREGGQWTKENGTTASGVPPPEVQQARPESSNSTREQNEYARGFGEGALQSLYDDARFSYRWFTPFGPLFGLVDRYLPDDLFGPPRGEIEASGRTVGTIAAIAATFLVGGPEAGVPRAAESIVEGSFSIIRWAGYPAYLPKPTGPFRLLSGPEYYAARAAADRANWALRRADPAAYADKEIHEIQPIKFGGNPIDHSNKMTLTPEEHDAVSAWWFRLMRGLQRDGLR